MSEKTKMYKVIAPNLGITDPKTGEKRDAKVGEFIALTDQGAKGLVNKVELAPTPKQLESEAAQLMEASKEMAAKAKKLLSGKSKKDEVKGDK